MGAHGVRGSLRVDAPSAVDVEMALAAAGLRYLRLASRRTPRPVVVASCRELKRFGATVRYVVALKGLRDREEAARLAGAVLYRRDEDNEEPVEAYEPSTKLEGLSVVDEHGEAVGVVWDVLDPNEGAALAAPLLSSSSKRRGTASCPWTRPASRYMKKRSSSLIRGCSTSPSTTRRRRR